MARRDKDLTVGALVAGVGLLLLLGNLGILAISLGTLIGLAFAALWGSMAYKVVARADRAEGVGFFLRLGFGSFLGLISLSIASSLLFGIGAGWLWNLFWPMLLIGSGLYMILRSGQGSVRGLALSQNSGVLLGTVNYGQPGVPIGHGRISVGIGDAIVDLTQGHLPEGETTVDIAVGIGDIEILVPRDVPIAAEINAGILDINFLDQRQELLFGQTNVATADYVEASRRVKVIVRAGIGDLDVTRLG